MLLGQVGFEGQVDDFGFWMGREEADVGRMVKHLHFSKLLNDNRSVSRCAPDLIMK
jgi:hypothetical protein